MSGSVWNAKPDLGLLRRVAAGLLLLLALGYYLVVGLAEVEANYNSAAADQNAHLQLGLDMIERGRLTNGITHPLYPALLTPFARREWSYFTLSKLTGLAIGLLSLLVTFLIARRLANAEVAALVVAVMAANPVYLEIASLVNCEILLVGLFLVSWYCLAEGFADRRFWPLAGLLCGLSYLTKGSGQLLVAVFLLTAVVVYRRGVFRQRAILYLLAVYLLTSSVLYVYNYRTYGNPLYNRVTTHEMWLDDWEGTYVAEESLPTIGTYFSSHTLGDAARRQVEGMWLLWPLFLADVLPLKSEPVRLLVAFVVAVGVLAGLWSQAGRLKVEKDAAARAIAALLLGLLLYLSAAWFARVFTASRFLFPLMAVLYLFVAEVLYRAGASLVAGRRAGAVAGGIFLAAAASASVWLVVGGLPYLGRLSGDPFRSDRQANESADRFLYRIWEGEPGGALVIWGPSRTLPFWRFSDRLAVEWIPSNLDSPKEGLEWLQATGAGYLIVDEKVIKRRSNLLGSFFRPEGLDRDLVGVLSYPDDWALFDLEPGLPCSWCAFRLMGAAPVDHPRQADFEEGIRLLGYELDRADAWPGGEVVLTLYWQATEDVERDYTVFVHLLGPDGKMWGQMDGQPLWGKWPTSRWPTGKAVADRRIVPVDRAAPPGEFRLSVGLYLLDGGERLKLAGSGLDELQLETKVTVGPQK